MLGALPCCCVKARCLCLEICLCLFLSLESSTSSIISYSIFPVADENLDLLSATSNIYHHLLSADESLSSRIITMVQQLHRPHPDTKAHMGVSRDQRYTIIIFSSCSPLIILTICATISDNQSKNHDNSAESSLMIAIIVSNRH